MATGNAFKMSLQELRDLMTFRGIEGVNKVRSAKADIQTSERGFHIGMDSNFVCLRRRHNCNWSLPFYADLLIYEINY